MSPQYGGPVKGLEVKNIKRPFLTHLHSDHTSGYPDLILTPRVMGRDEPPGGNAGNLLQTNFLKRHQEIRKKQKQYRLKFIDKQY